MKLHILHTGKVGVYKGTPMRDPNPLHKFGIGQTNRDRLALPVSAYVIEHPKGTIVIDTGWSEQMARDGAPFPISKFSAPLMRPEESLKSQLETLGLKPGDIDAVYLSHLDLDHTSGLADMKAARSFHASAPEIRDTKTHLLRYQKDTFDFVDLEPFEYRDTGLGPVGKSYDVFKDGSVQLISIPGHTDGLFTVKVQDKNGKYVLLPGDTAYLQRSIHEELLPGYCMSTRQAKRSVQWLRGQSEDPDCLLIAPNHDPSIQPQTIEFDEEGKKDPVITIHKNRETARDHDDDEPGA